MNINGYFIYNGVDTRALGVDVSRGVAGNILRRPVREYQVSQPPGRLGDIIQDNRHFPNVEIAYHVMIPDNFDAVYRQLRGALLGATGYARLEDSWNTEEFYQAYVSAPLQPTVSANRRQGMLEVTFSRRPERWLKSGETVITPPVYNTSRIDLEAQDYPTVYEHYPFVHLRCKAAVPDSGWATSFGFLTVYRRTAGSMTVLKTLSLYKAYTASWSNYLAANDEFFIDFSTGQAQNTTRNIDLTGIVSSDVVNGIPFPLFYGADTRSLVLELPSAYIEFVGYTPRWYAI